MYNFLVLGLVPGTNIQISFEAWLIGMMVLGMAAAFSWQEIRLRFLAQTSANRRVMHASQLHSRAPLATQ